MVSTLIPKVRAIRMPVNDYFVQHFVDIPKFRYNKIPLETVTKDKDGFRLRLDVKDHPEYFIPRNDVSAPNSGGNTTNVFLGLVALYSAMQVDAQFKVILPDDQSSIAQQEINDHVSTKIAQEFEVLQVDPAHAGKYQVGRGDARIAGHLFYPYFIDVMNDGLSAALAASELGAALSALMHHGKKSNITTLNEDALNKLVVRCIDKVQRNESRGVDLTSVESRGRRTSRETPNRASL